MAKHTPGPWKAYEAIEDMPLPAGVPVAVGTEVGGGKRTSIVCEMVGQGDGKYDPAVTRANSFLIAAAPKMLTALEAVKLRLHFVGMPQEPRRDDGAVDWRKEIALIEDALKAVRGED